MAELRTRSESSKRGIIKELELLEGVFFINDFYGNGLAVSLLCPNESAQRHLVRQMKLIAGDRQPYCWSPASRSTAVQATRADLRILRTLARRSHAIGARAERTQQLSYRTFARHLERLRTSGALQYLPVLDIPKAGGVRTRFLVLAGAVIVTEARRRLEQEGISLISAEVGTAGELLLIAQCSNAAEAARVRSRLQEVAGVHFVRAELTVRHIHVYQWIEEELGRRLEALERNVAPV